MATLTLSATPLPNSTPPTVRLDVTATGTPTVSSVTITRTDVGGRSYPVRTSDGGPLPVSGGVATVFDPEIPYGSTSTYQAQAAGVAAVTAAATLDVADLWLVHPGVPALSRPITLRIGSNNEEAWNLEQGMFPILGSEFPIPVTGGARIAPASTLIVATETPSEAEGMRQLLADGSALLLNVPASSGLGLSTCYISVAGVRLRRPSDIGTDPMRDLELSYQVVGRPAGGSQALITWQTVYDGYGQPTWAQLYAAAGQPTWAELANPIT